MDHFKKHEKKNSKKQKKTVNRYYLDGGDVDLDDLRGGGTRVQQPSAQCFAHFRRQKRVLLRHLKGLVVVECFRWLVVCWVVYWVLFVRLGGGGHM